MADTRAAIELLSAWLSRRLAPEGRDWFNQQLDAVRAGGGLKALGRAMGFAPRKLGKADLAPTEAELAEARLLKPGFDPSQWSVDQVARTAFVLAAYGGDDAAFAALVETLSTTAEVNEMVAIYQGFALFPAGPLLEPRAREANRSSVTPLFDAMALRNPYPAEHFSEAAFNQVVVKAVFVGRPLWAIHGLDARANADLAGMLAGLATERRKASRPISPEIWRIVVPHGDAAARALAANVLETGSENERLAIAKALAGTTAAELALLREQAARLGLAGRATARDWSTLDVV